MSKFKVGDVVYWKGDNAQNYPMTISSIEENEIVEVTFFSGGLFRNTAFSKEELSLPN